MQASRAGNAYTTALLFLIIAVLFTLIFGALTWMRHDEAVLHRTGIADDPEYARSIEESLNAKQDEIAKLKATLASLDKRRRTAASVINALAMKIGARSASYEPYTSEGVYEPGSGRWVLDPNAEDGKATSRFEEMFRHVTTTNEILIGKKEALSTQDHIFKPMEEVISVSQQDTQNVLREITEIDAQTQELLDLEKNKFDELEKEREANQKLHSDRYSTLSTQISQAKERIRELLELELQWVTEILPDGRIRSTDSNRRYVYINLGAKERVFNGLVFEIFQYVKGRMVHKGWCEVIETEQETATCRVTEETDPRRNPIAKDDMIGNPVFTTRRPMVFHFAGEFRQFNKADLEEFVRRSGGEVRERLEPGVDYLVVGEEMDNERHLAEDKAREYHILAMFEHQLVPFLYRTFKYQPKVDDGLATAP